MIRSRLRASWYGAVLAGLCMLVCTAAGRADSSRPDITAATVAIPPLVTYDKQTGAVGGTAVAAAHAIADKCGLTLNITIPPSWARAYQMAVEGRVDSLLPTTKNIERLEVLEFPAKPFFTLYPALVVREDSPFERFTSLSMLDGRSVGIQPNMRLDPAFDSYIRGGSVTVVERGGAVSLLEELMAGRVDFLADSIMVLRHHLGASSIDGRVRALDPPLGETPQFFALSKKRRPHLAGGTPAARCLLGTQ